MSTDHSSPIVLFDFRGSRRVPFLAGLFFDLLLVGLLVILSRSLPDKAVRVTGITTLIAPHHARPPKPIVRAPRISWARPSPMPLPVVSTIQMPVLVNEGRSIPPPPARIPEPVAPAVRVATGSFPSGTTIADPRTPVRKEQTGMFAAAAIPSRIEDNRLKLVQDAGFSRLEQASSGHRSREVDTVGFGSASAVRRTGDRMRGVGPSDTFGELSAVGRPSRVAVQTQEAAFGNVQTVARSASARRAASEQVFHPVEIIIKPKAGYTDEARRRKIEGEVWLEVLFGADGRLRVQRVIRSLGFGLDENAISATTRIQFKPASEGTRAVDEVATVRVQFQLAE